MHAQEREVMNMSAKIGRPKSDNPRNKGLNLRLTEAELKEIAECAEKNGKSRTDTILDGIRLLSKTIK